MSKKIPLSTITPFGLRLQPELKSLLEGAASANNRSLNAEIAQRLETSFELPPEQANVGRGIEALADLIEKKDTFIQTQGRLLAMLALFLKLVNERVASSKNPVSNRLTEITGQIADRLIEGDLEAAAKHISEMVELGTHLGILDENGKVKADQEYLIPVSDILRKKHD